MDNIFRVYSRQFSRGGVALIAVVHRGFASVPLFSFFLLLPAQSPLSLLPFLLPSPFLLRISSSSSFVASTTGFVSFFSLSSSSFSRIPLFFHVLSPHVRFHEVQRYTAILAGLICAQQERHELMHVAHAGRESVGSLSSRTPALTRIHHRATLRRAVCVLRPF